MDVPLSRVGWLVSAAVWVDDEAQCDESTSLLCFEPGEIWLITGVRRGIWLLGIVVIAAVVGFAWMWKRLGLP